MGDTIEGSIVHLTNSDKIYMQLFANKPEIDTVYEAMSVYYNAGRGKGVAEVVKGSSYVVQFTQDNEWYRARVVNIDGDNISVS